MAVTTLPTGLISDRVSTLETMGYKPAGAENKSPLVYENVGGIVYLAFHVEDNPNLGMLLSNTSAIDHWILQDHGLDQQWNPAISHLYRADTFVLIDSATDSRSFRFRVRENTTKAQRLIKPTDPNGNLAYEPWVIN